MNLKKGFVKSELWTYDWTCFGKGFEVWRLRHGQAVLIGMWIEAAWTASLGWTESGVVDALDFICNKLDMSIEIRDTISSKSLFDAIRSIKRCNVINYNW